MNNIASIVQAEAAHREAVQALQYKFFYTQTTLVPNGGTASVVVTISNDADFDIKAMSGRAYGPVDANGLFVGGAGSDFPTAGAAPSADYACSGLMMRMTDQGRSLELASDFVFVETILPPAYGNIRYQLQPFEYLLKRNSTLRIDLRNRDTMTAVGVPLFHLFAITLYGTKLR
jgi:hypothetical protein